MNYLEASIFFTSNFSLNSFTLIYPEWFTSRYSKSTYAFCSDIPFILLLRTNYINLDLSMRGGDSGGKNAKISYYSLGKAENKSFDNLAPYSFKYYYC